MGWLLGKGLRFLLSRKGLGVVAWTAGRGRAPSSAVKVLVVPRKGESI